MEYNRLVAITALPGLFELVSSKSDGALVRSLEDNSTKFVSSRVHNLSHLESIEVYTTGENVNLADILTAIEKSGEPLPDVKDNKQLKAYFEKVYPELDFDRVYSSDMKKMIKWFETLKKNNVEIKLSEPAAKDESTENDETPVAETTPSTAEVPASTDEAAQEETPAVEKPKTRKKKTS